MRAFTPSLACLVVIAAAALARGGGGVYNSYAEKPPPELLSAKSHWVNAEGKTTLAALKGKLVWLQFHF